MAKEALNSYLDGAHEENRRIPLSVNRSNEGLFSIEVDKDIAKRIFTSKIESLQKEREDLNNSKVNWPPLLSEIWLLKSLTLFGNQYTYC